MPKEYSLYEAKAKLSSLVRMVREGRPVWITVHGKAVAELREIPEEEARGKTTAERRAEMEQQGLIHQVRVKPGKAKFPLGIRKPGALKRFLEERD